MHDDLTQYLLNDRSTAPLSAESLEMMGKQAANHYLEYGLPLARGIAKLASEHPDINSDQIKRVVEFANTAVHLGLHDKNKKAGASDSYPQFDLADARPTRLPPVSVEYSRRHQTEKLSSATSDAIMADLFKTAAPEEPSYTKDSVIDDVMGVKSDLTSLKEHIQHSAQELDVLFKTASEEFYELSKRHLLEGGPFADIVAAARVPGVSYEKVAAALQPHVTRLIKEKVASPQELRDGVEGFEKVAHRVLNPAHPLVTSFRAILSSDQEIEKVAVALREVDVELDRVSNFVRERLRAPSSR
jgi:hypothetical protein